MIAVDIWRLATLLVQGAAVGFSPILLPFLILINFFPPEEWWKHVTEGRSCFELIAVWMPATAIVTYWVNGLFLLLVDMLVRPEVLQQFRIQPEKRFDHQKLGSVCKNLLAGQFGVIVPYALACAFLSQKLNNDFNWGIEYSSELPSGLRMFKDHVCFIIFDEIAFFYGHWALHSKICGVNLYTKFHKIHHEFTAPIGLVASYCHPFEMLISNAFPLTFGALICRAHVWSILLWTGCAVLGTQFHHCGFRWPWVVPDDHNPNFHDFHHQKFVCNYGLLGWLDKLHGTDKLWNEHLKQQKATETHPWGKATRIGAAVAIAGAVVSQLAA